LVLALPPGGKGSRVFQCLECDRRDPIKTDQAIGWLKGELVAAEVRPPHGAIHPISWRGY
jgi:hypothetical protein